jgi:hypothetical protein
MLYWRTTNTRARKKRTKLVMPARRPNAFDDFIHAMDSFIISVEAGLFHRYIRFGHHRRVVCFTTFASLAAP